MFPTRLPALPDFTHSSSMLIGIGSGGGGIGLPGGGGIGGPAIYFPTNPGGSSSGGGGRATSVGIFSDPTNNLLSSVLGIPSINWGRIAAFLLGLLLIAGGIYLIRPVQNVVNKTIRTSSKAAIAA